MPKSTRVNMSWEARRREQIQRTIWNHWKKHPWNHHYPGIKEIRDEEHRTLRVDMKDGYIAFLDETVTVTYYADRPYPDHDFKVLVVEPPHRQEEKMPKFTSTRFTTPSSEHSFDKIVKLPVCPFDATFDVVGNLFESEGLVNAEIKVFIWGQDHNDDNPTIWKQTSAETRKEAVELLVGAAISHWEGIPPRTARKAAIWGAIMMDDAVKKDMLSVLKALEKS